MDRNRALFIWGVPKVWTQGFSFELDTSPNHQNDRILEHSPIEVPNFERNKFPGKLMVWEGMSAKGLTKYSL